MEPKKLEEIGLSTSIMDADQTLSHIDKLKRRIDYLNYTAFEVFPTTETISSGVYDCNFYNVRSLPSPTKENYEKYLNSILKCEDKKYRLVSNGTSYEFVETTDYTVAEQFGRNFDNVTGIPYTNAVDPSGACGITFKTYVDKDDNDIVIDWGDGKETRVVDLELGVENDGTTLVNYEDVETEDIHDDRKVEIKHIYNVSDCNKRMVVKIYGLNYTTLRTYCSGVKNICSRIFDRDLPISGNLIAVSAICANHSRLLKLNMTEFYNFKNVVNIFAMFKCTEIGKNNLKKAYVSGYNSIYFKRFTASGEVFYGCTSLIDSNFRLPAAAESYVRFYAGCINLESKICNLLPQQGFTNRILYTAEAFKGCKKISGKISDVVISSNSITCDKLLWNDDSKIHVCSETFKDCTSIQDYNVIPSNWK